MEGIIHIFFRFSLLKSKSNVGNRKSNHFHFYIFVEFDICITDYLFTKKKYEKYMYFQFAHCILGVLDFIFIFIYIFFGWLLQLWRIDELLIEQFLFSIISFSSNID